MLDHVTIRVSDRTAARPFYMSVLGEPTYLGDDFDEWGDFSLTESDAAHPVTRNLHIAFALESVEETLAFANWRRGVNAFPLDPDGNSIKTAPGVASAPPIHHLWLGVADLAASRRFWEAVAPVLEFDVREELNRGFMVAGRDGRHITLIGDGRPPTEHLHFAFPVASDEAVAEFHRTAVAAGYRDDGAPGERPQYHAGYVGAFVLDPDGNSVEAVNHNR